MSDILRYPLHQSDPTQPVPSDWVPSYGSGELYQATSDDNTSGAARNVRDLHIKLENVLKGADGSGGGGRGGGGGGGVDQKIHEIVQQMLCFDVPMHEKYGRLGVADLLMKNKLVKGKDGLPILSAALGILEKYGRNLLKASRPSQWKTISFSNAVFRQRVDIIKGARDVLHLLGYTVIVEDGVCFPDDVPAPDTNNVAVVTADLILAKLEIEAFLKKAHPNSDRVTECLEGTVLRYPPSGVNRPAQTAPSSGNRRAIEPVSDDQLGTPAIPIGASDGQLSRPAISGTQYGYHGYQPNQSSSGSASKPPPYAPKPAWMQNSAGFESESSRGRSGSTDQLVCSMCGQDSATKSCNTCPDRLRCEQCDVKWHGHPDRSFHVRQDIHPVIQAPIVIPPSAAMEDDAQSASPPKMCSVCGGEQATKYCKQCDAVSCDNCATKMHQHPKRKNHELTPISGSSSPRRRSPEGRSIRVPPGDDKQERQEPAGQAYPQQPQQQPLQQQQQAITRPEQFNNNQQQQVIRRPDQSNNQQFQQQEIRRPDQFNNNQQQQTIARQDQFIDQQNQQQEIRRPDQFNNHQQQAIARLDQFNNQQQHQQQVIRRPDQFNNKQMPYIHSQPQQQLPNVASDGVRGQMRSPDSGGQQPVQAERKRPVPKPRKNIKSPTTPTGGRSDGEFGQRPASSLSTNIGQPQQPSEPTSPSDPRKDEIESIMARDVDLLERIAGIRNNLKSLPRNQPQYNSLMMMENSLWDEHKELMQRQAELEKSMQEPSVSPIQRGYSMNVDIRRPPVADKPLAVIPDETRLPQSGSDYRSTPYGGRSQSTRRPQDIVSPRPPAEGWECNSCGFLNDGNRLHCESCNSAYSSRPSNQGMQRPVINQNQTMPYQNQPTYKPPEAYPSRQVQPPKIQSRVGGVVNTFEAGSDDAFMTPQQQQQQEILQSPSRNAVQQARNLEAQLPGGLPFGVANQAVTKPKQWTCQFCTFTNIMDITVCQMCNERREAREVTSTSSSPPQSPKAPVQRQQTEGDRRFQKDEKDMTAYEYMQLEEEKMLREKQKAKSEDHSMGSKQPTSDILTKPPKSSMVAGASPMVPPIVKGAGVAPLSDAMEKLKLKESDGERLATSPGRDIGEDKLSMSHTAQIQERRLLAEQATEGLAFVNNLRQAETNGFCVEDVTVASQIIEESQSTEDVVPWLQQYWDDFKSTATAQATNALNDSVKGQRIRLSEEEVVDALYKHEGKMERVVQECIEQRQQKISELESYGFQNSQAVQAISMCDGSVDKALMKLQEAAVQDFYNRLWEKDEDDKELLERLKQIPSDNEHEQYLRSLLAEFDISSWGRARTAARLIAAEKYNITDAVTAARECGDYERATQFLEKECQVCYAEYPHNQLMCLSHCAGCLVCSECLAGHFKAVITGRNIIHATCPACNKPDAKDATELADYFSFLDSLLRTLLDEDTLSLFQHKLRDWNLQKEENFRWCAHCRNGFINEAPDRRKMRCPECAKITCFNCKKPWLDQHENITCQEFEQWKQDNDPERAAQGVAYHLKENGIDCPQCKMRYELAKGGCMHFKCTQCMFEFCCGCNKPFLQGNECDKFASCANRGLHSHHPRDCLFHLRDWDVKQLQKLLDKHAIAYDVQPPQGQEGQQRGCRVMEQKETPEGLNDGKCGKEVPPRHAGLCKIHYTEYLVGLINQNLIDPAETFSCHELNIVLSRNEVPVPQRQGGEAEQAYQKRLLREVQQKLPFQDKPPRDRP